MLDGPNIRNHLTLNVAKWQEKISWIEFLDDILIYHKGKLKKRFLLS